MAITIIFNITELSTTTASSATPTTHREEHITTSAEPTVSLSAGAENVHVGRALGYMTVGDVACCVHLRNGFSALSAFFHPVQNYEIYKSRYGHSVQRWQRIFGP